MSPLYRMYEPPKHCRIFPVNAVNEWSLNAAKECLIPADPTQHSASIQHRNLRPNRELDHVTISNAESNVLTFSLVQKQSDSMQCKVYWQGQEHRLCPEDVLETKTVLKDIFSRTHYLESDAGNMRLMDLAKMITDTEFAYFRNISHFNQRPRI